MMITDHATLLCYSVYVMACAPCKSPGRRVFTAEMNIHFPGRENLDKPAIWAFPLDQHLCGAQPLGYDSRCTN